METVNEQEVGRGVTVRILADDDYNPDWALDWCRVGEIRVSAGRGEYFGDAPFDDEEGFYLSCEHCAGSGESEERWQIQVNRPFGYEVTASGSYEAMQYIIDNEYGGQHLANVEHNRTLTRATCRTCKGEGERMVSVERYFKETEGATVVLPVEVFNDWRPRLGIASSFDRASGVVFDTPQGRKDTGVEPGNIKQCLRDELEHYANALSGEVFGYIITIDGDEHHPDLAQGGSCWGFVGEEDYVLEAGVEEAKLYVEQREKRAQDNADYVAMTATD